MFPYVRPYQVK